MSDGSLPTILVVDDDARTLRACKRSHQGRFVILTASSLEDGREILPERAVDFAVIDIVLPDGSGLELLEEITSDQPKAKRAIVSGWFDFARAVVAGRLADVVAAKPASFKRVIAELESPTAVRPVVLGGFPFGSDATSARLEEIADRAIEQAFLKHDKNVSKTARELDVGRPTLYRALRRLGLRGPD